MSNILVINSSLSAEVADSSQLSNKFAAALASQTKGSITTRYLANENLPHLSQAEMAAWMTDANERDATQDKLASISDTAIAEVQDADTIVLGLPMYNFGIPSVLKAWIDRIARAGITFRYTENGPEGLLLGKKVIVMATRGGKYAGTPLDTQSQYIKDVFAFLGIQDVEFVYAEGIAMGEKEQAIANAEARIDSLAQNAA